MGSSLSRMYAGVDLAWGQRARTGVALVDDSGTLVASTSVHTDAQIKDFLAPHAATLASVAVDAPLIVTNATGQRPCEREIAAVFGRYGAGAYPANTSNPHFNPPRAATLARALGWAIDPARVGHPGSPTCLEVYPHPAMVGLFSLPYTIPYKGKKGRDLASLQAAYEVLLDSMERHLPQLDLPRNERWAALRTTASGAQRKFELERIEDEIDAIVCAHLAWLWAHRPGALQVYGDVQTGYIVAPPPPSHPPAPRVTQGSPAKAGMPPGSPSAVVLQAGDELEDLAVDLRRAVPRLTLEEARLLATRARQHFGADSQPSRC